MPLSPGRPERHGFEYFRHGTLSLYAALIPQTGDVLGQTAARHASQAFVAFLGAVVETQSQDQEIHIILDNLSAHKTSLVDEFLFQHRNVTLHFTPTYSSWLNQVESWFFKLRREVLYRGIFSSVADLRAESCATSGSMLRSPNRFSGNTPTSNAEFATGNDVSQTAHSSVGI